MTAFRTLPLSEQFLANLDSLGYREMTEIYQELARAVGQPQTVSVS